MAKTDTYSGAKKESKQPPAGTHNLRICSIIDMGTQPGAKPGWDAKPKLVFNFELVDTDVDFGKGYGEPFHRTLSFNPYLGTTKEGKATKYKDFLQRIMGRALRVGESFTRDKLVGKACKGLFVEEDDFKKHEELLKEDPNAKVPKKIVFQSVSSVGVDEAKEIAKLRNPKIYFELPSEEDPDPICRYAEPGEKGIELNWVDCFNNLNKWMQKDIAKSKEFNVAITKQKLKFDPEKEVDQLYPLVRAKAKPVVQDTEEDADGDDDIPF